jgi:hypothetical protein
VHRDLELCRDGLRRAVAGLSSADSEISPGGVWSIANIIEHLDLTYTRNATALERRLAKGNAPERKRTLRQSAIRTLIVTIGYFPPGRTAPDMVVPQGKRFTEVAVQLDAHLDQLDRCLAEGERVFGARRPVLDHPVIGPFSISDWRRFHWVHTRHHLKQIQVRRAKFAPR